MGKLYDAPRRNGNGLCNSAYALFAGMIPDMRPADWYRGVCYQKDHFESLRDHSMMTIVEEWTMRTMAAGKFKAQCLAVMDEVHAKRVPVVLTKNGKPVAKLVPLDIPEAEDPLDAFYFGGIEIVGDIMKPVYTDAEWEQFFEESAQELR
jgi:prevent-host-death family protein